MEDVVKLKEAVEALQARLHEEVTQRGELERRCHLLEKLAHRDPSTGLRTEYYLCARVQEEIERSIRYPSATTLITLCAPADNMSSLPQLGMRLAEELRASDHLFRLTDGGLAILLVETAADGAKRVLDRISPELQHFLNGYSYSVTSFPVDTNLAEEFLPLAMERHNELAQKYHPEGPNSSSRAASVH